MLVASNWKTILLLIQLGLIAVTIATGHVLAGEVIDNPGGP
jgi:hypothetical protein